MLSERSTLEGGSMGIRKKQPGLTRRASKEIRQLAKVATAHGWSVETLDSGHIRFTKAGRKPLVTGPTSTDWRTVKNLRAALEREQDE
jgi:hypothetical protein